MYIMVCMKNDPRINWYTLNQLLWQFRTTFWGCPFWPSMGVTNFNNQLLKLIYSINFERMASCTNSFYMEIRLHVYHFYDPIFTFVGSELKLTLEVSVSTLLISFLSLSNAIMFSALVTEPELSCLVKTTYHHHAGGPEEFNLLW